VLVHPCVRACRQPALKALSSKVHESESECCCATPGEKAKKRNGN
jgi:hypothetical protein